MHRLVINQLDNGLHTLYSLLGLTVRQAGWRCFYYSTSKFGGRYTLMKYQLVLQFSGDAGEDLDAIVDLEDQLADALGDDTDVDGHDIGSGQTNLFIFTSNPSATFQAANRVLDKAEMLNCLTAAFREVDGEDYTVLWPSGSTKKFEVI